MSFWVHQLGLTVGQSGKGIWVRCKHLITFLWNQAGSRVWRLCCLLLLRQLSAGCGAAGTRPRVASGVLWAGNWSGRPGWVDMSTFREQTWAGKAFVVEKFIMSCRLWHLFIWQKEPKARIALLSGPDLRAVGRQVDWALISHSYHLENSCEFSFTRPVLVASVQAPAEIPCVESQNCNLLLSCLLLFEEVQVPPQLSLGGSQQSFILE